MLRLAIYQTPYFNKNYNSINLRSGDRTMKMIALSTIALSVVKVIVLLKFNQQDNSDRTCVRQSANVACVSAA